MLQATVAFGIRVVTVQVGNMGLREIARTAKTWFGL